MAKPRRTKTSMIFNQTGRLKFGEKEKAIFLSEYRKTGQLFRSAEAAGVSSSTVKDHRKVDEQFRLACEEAINLYRDALEAEILRRAVNGVAEPVYKDVSGPNEPKVWEVVGHIQRYSDQLLMFHAKRHIAAYRDDKKGEDDSGGGVIVIPGGGVSEDEWVKQNQNT